MAPNPRPRTAQQRAISAAIAEATMPHEMARLAAQYLKQTPEYEQARREKRARAWLEAESMSIGYALAETLRNRMEDLEP